MGERGKAIVRNTGAGMMTICLSLLLIRLADWSKIHSTTITVGIYVSGAIAIGCFLVWFYTYKDSSTQTVSNKTNNTTSTGTGGDNSSRSLIAETINYHESSVHPPEPYVPFPPPNVHPGVQPKIQISGAETVSVAFLPLKAEWTLAPTGGGRPGVVVWVTNTAASVGQKAIMAKNLAVTILFQDFNGLTAHQVSRAYWLNHSSNEVHLGIGERRAVLIGTVQGQRWATYDNPLREEYQVGRKMPRGVLPSASPHELSIPDFRVEVTLLDTEDGTTHGSIWFRLKLADDYESVEVASYK